LPLSLFVPRLLLLVPLKLTILPLTVRHPPNNWRTFFGGSVWEWDETTEEVRFFSLPVFLPLFRASMPRSVLAEGRTHALLLCFLHSTTSTTSALSSRTSNGRTTKFARCVSTRFLFLSPELTLNPLPGYLPRRCRLLARPWRRRLPYRYRSSCVFSSFFSPAASSTFFPFFLPLLHGPTPPPQSSRCLVGPSFVALLTLTPICRSTCTRSTSTSPTRLS
jgi:hypothetical protein